MKRTVSTRPNAATMQWEYIRCAAYYFFRAVGDTEQVVSALYRDKAAALRQLLDQYSVRVPDAEEIYGYAKDKWQAHQLHPFTERTTNETTRES
jgi:hypothetical protein